MPISILLTIIVFVYIHESMHFLAFKILKIEFEYKIIWKYHLPIAFYVFSSYFNCPFYKMGTLKQKEYFIIAIMPYFVVLPIAVYMYSFSNFYLSTMGLIVMVTHFVNLPLEFVKV